MEAKTLMRQRLTPYARIWPGDSPRPRDKEKRYLPRNKEKSLKSHDRTRSQNQNSYRTPASDSGTAAHDGAVTITDPRYALIAAGLHALYLWNCRTRGSYTIRASDAPQQIVDPALIQEAVMALHGPYAAPIVSISKPDHNPGDWTMAFELPCDLHRHA